MRAKRGNDALLAALVTMALAFAVYALTAARDITWAYHGADGPELITAAVTLGVPHPPGYPLYVFLGKLVSLLPFGSVAFRFNLFSAVCMALSCGLVAGLIVRLRLLQTARASLPSAAPAGSGAATLALALAAGLSLAFLPLIWQQAVITEVYALNMLAVTALLWRLYRRPRANSGLHIGFFLGLAVTTHLTSLLLTPAAIVAVRRKQWKLFVFGGFIGLSPFAALPWLASRGSPVIWGWTDDLNNWWWLVSATLYRPNVLSLSPTRWGERLTTWSAEPSLWIAAALLIFILYRHFSDAGSSDKLTAVLLIAALLYGVYAFGYAAQDALVFLLPAIAILFLLAALAVERPTPAYLLLPVMLLMLNYQQIDLSNHTEARSMAESPLREAPQDAILLTSGDRTTFTFWYLQHVEGQRGDVTIVDGDLLAFDWYRARIARTNPQLRGTQRDDMSEFRRLNQQLRPICEVELGIDKTVQYDCRDAPA